MYNILGYALITYICIILGFFVGILFGVIITQRIAAQMVKNKIAVDYLKSKIGKEICLHAEEEIGQYQEYHSKKIQKKQNIMQVYCDQCRRKH